MRNALAYVPKAQQSMASASLRQAFGQEDADKAHQVWRAAADQMRERWPKLGVFMDNSEHDVLAYMGFPEQHRAKLHSTNPLERRNKEVKRRADVVGIFPSEQSILRLIGAVLLEQNDEWQLQHRYMQVEGMSGLIPPSSTARLCHSRLPRSHPKPHDPRPPKPTPKLHQLDGHYPTGRLV